METPYLLAGICVMSGVTFAIRAVPLAAIRKRFKNRFLLSFLYYLPYGVLSAMIFPAVFTSCGSVAASAVGCVTALVLAFFRCKLIVVAAAAVAAAWLTAALMPLFGLM